MKFFAELKVNDIFEMADGKSYIMERFGRSSRGMMVAICTDEKTGQGWKIRRNGTHPITLIGKKPMIKAKLGHGQMMIWKGNKGEAMVFRHLRTEPNGTVIALNPIDGRQWTLSGNGASYASYDDVINGDVKL